MMTRVNIIHAFIGLLTLVFWLIYLYFIDVDVLMFDQLNWVEDYDAFINGNLPFSSLWEPYGGHRMPGYKVLFFLNIWLFGFSPQLESLTAIVPFVLAAVYLSYKFSESLVVGNASKLLIFIAFLLVFCNAQSVRESYYSVIITQLGDYVGFLIVAGLAFEIFNPDRSSSEIKIWSIFILSIWVFIFLFGRGYGVGASLSIIALCFMALLNDPKNRDLWAIIVVLGLAVAIYLNGFWGKGQGVANGFDFANFSNFTVTKFGNAFYGMFDLTNQFEGSERISFVFGTILLGLVAIIIARYSTSVQIGQAEWLAMFMILMSLSSLMLIAVLRYSSSPLYPRHNLEISLGFIGIAYFILKFLVEHFRQKSGQSIATILVLMVSIFSISNYVELIQEARKTAQFYNGIENNQIRFLKGTNSIETYKFKRATCYASPTKCEEIFQLMVKHGISEKRYSEGLRKSKF